MLNNDVDNELEINEDIDVLNETISFMMQTIRSSIGWSINRILFLVLLNLLFAIIVKQFQSTVKDN